MKALPAHFAHFALFAAALVVAVVAPGGTAHADPGASAAESRPTIASVTVELPEGLTATLAGARSTHHVASLPLAENVHADVELRRFDPSAPGARIRVIESRGEPYEIPRSDRIHFLGHSLDGTARLGLSMDPDGTNWTGLAIGPFGTTEIRSDDGRRLHLLDAAQTDAMLETRCEGDLLPIPDEARLAASAAAPPAILRPRAATTFQITVAVDTDNELHDLRFDNDTTAATNWLADLFTAMNVYYERDVDLNLVQGDTTFRLDTDPVPTYDDDPWTVTGSPASQTHLSEFGSYWSSNMGAVDRTFAMLLSGKSSSEFSTSGIAWVDGYCENQSTGGGYSVTQTFRFTESVVASGARVIAHEIGHNAGSPHTHCYTPPIDECYALESGCYSGSVSCPAEGTGTIMSYCHFTSGANCGASRNEFHPTVIGLFTGFLTAHFPFCVGSGAGDIFSDGFESGDTTAW